jgi:ferredoxin
VLKSPRIKRPPANIYDCFVTHSPLDCATMTFVVTASCLHCKHTDCVDVCPMDCFREGPDFLVIDPELCIDCSMCVPQCPVDAIYHDIDLPAAQRHFLDLNARLAASAAWRPITQSKAPLPDHLEWASVDKTLLMPAQEI